MYGQLPSYVIANGTTFDILVTHALTKYERDLANGVADKPETPTLTQEEMYAMIKRVKEQQ